MTGKDFIAAANTFAADVKQQEGADMWLEDQEGRQIRFAAVETVDNAQLLWRLIAGLHIGQNLRGFEVRVGARLVYRGDYTTDEA